MNSIFFRFNKNRRQEKVKKNRIIKNIFIMVLVLLSIVIAGAYINYCINKVPKNVFVLKNETATLDLNIPVTGECKTVSNNAVSSDIDFSKPVTFVGNELGKYRIKIKLFNLFDVKTVNVNVVDTKMVYSGGFQVGMYFKMDGVLVSGISEIKDADGNMQNPCEDKLQTGDYIVSVNNIHINSKKQLNKIVADSGGETLEVLVRRDGNYIDYQIKPVTDEDGDCRIGIWVKDDTQGIGTVTYVTRDGKFGALGHGISDSDVNKLIEVKNGSIYKTKIFKIIRGSNGSPGELLGSILYSDMNKIGTINENTKEGIYGKIDLETIRGYKLKQTEVMFSSNVKCGKAYVRFYNGSEFKDYDINITHLSGGEKKNITFEVTSEELLEKTNGIVQGMSGCPIIQDDKIIGAVTHVLIDNPAGGYGIYIENMMDHN